MAGGISVLDNINYKGQKPNFTRDQFETLSEMVAFSENYLPPIFEAFCLENSKKYRYNVSNTEDALTGKWREVDIITNLPDATAETKGVIQVGDMLSVEDGVLSADVQSEENFTSELKTKLENININDKVDKVEGKGLSTNDLTDELKIRYDSAQKNVQSDWSQQDYTKDDFIKGKPTKLSSFENDLEFITKTVENLDNFYNRDQTFSQTEIKSLINAVNSLDIEVVEELPTFDISQRTIYLLKRMEAGVPVYNEYVYTKDEEWVNIGPASIDTTIKVNQESEDSDPLCENIKINNVVYKVYAHKHINKSVLDKIGEDEKGNVTYNGLPIKGESSWIGTKQEWNDFDKTLLPDECEVIIIDEVEDVVMQRIYPVGSIYLSLDDTNPAEIFGFGTWQRIGKGKTLWGAVNDEEAGSEIAAGIPNITGTFAGVTVGSGYKGSTGAFANNVVGSTCNTYGLSDGRRLSVNLDASCGETRKDGIVQNNVYGKSDTVQPPALVVNFWYRVS